MTEIPSSGMSLQIKMQMTDIRSSLLINQPISPQGLIVTNAPPECSCVEARYASKSKKAKEADDPADAEAEQGDIVGVLTGEEVDVQEVPGSAKAGDQSGRVGAPGNCHHGTNQAIVTMMLNKAKIRQRMRRILFSGCKDTLEDIGEKLDGEEN